MLRVRNIVDANFLADVTLSRRHQQFKFVIPVPSAQNHALGDKSAHLDWLCVLDEDDFLPHHAFDCSSSHLVQIL